MNKIPQDAVEKAVRGEISSAGKPNKFDKLEAPDNVKHIVKWALLIRFENYLLSQFYHRANLCGLHLDDNDFRRLDVYNPAYWESSEISDGKIEYYIRLYLQRKNHIGQKRYISPLVFSPAIAQHSGLPTRFLDWTKNPRKAIFFAAYRALKNSSSRYISIYAYKEMKGGGTNPILIKDHYQRSRNHFLHC